MRLADRRIMAALRLADFSVLSLSLEAISRNGSRQFYTLCLEDEPRLDLTVLDLVEALRGIAVPYVVRSSALPGRLLVHLVADKELIRTTNMYVQVPYNVT